MYGSFIELPAVVGHRAAELLKALSPTEWINPLPANPSDADLTAAHALWHCGLAFEREIHSFNINGTTHAITAVKTGGCEEQYEADLNAILVYQWPDQNALPESHRSTTMKLSAAGEGLRDYWFPEEADRIAAVAVRLRQIGHPEVMVTYEASANGDTPEAVARRKHTVGDRLVEFAEQYRLKDPQATDKKICLAFRKANPTLANENPGKPTVKQLRDARRYRKQRNSGSAKKGGTKKPR